MTMNHVEAWLNFYVSLARMPHIHRSQPLMQCLHRLLFRCLAILSIRRKTAMCNLFHTPFELSYLNGMREGWVKSSYMSRSEFLTYLEPGICAKLLLLVRVSSVLSFGKETEQ